MIPDYLRKPSDAIHIYGELSFSKDKFHLTGEPIIIEYGKRVFPGATVKGRKELIFNRSRREVSDLNWLLLRYPVKILCGDVYNEAIQDVIGQLERRITGDDHKPTTPSPVFLGDLYNYQKEGVTFLVSNKRALLGDGMGLGKTWTALGAVSVVDKWPVLIVCQTNIMRQWQRVIGSLFDLPSKYQKSIFDTSFDIAIKRGSYLAPILRGHTVYDIPETPFTVIHYGLLSYWSKALLERNYKIVIFDEVQELRNTGTYKYSAASLLSGKADHVYGLSGTPVFGYGHEIWSVMNSIDFHCLGSKEAFSREWCTGYGDPVVSDPMALNGYLVREGLMLRRKAQDVSIELPKISRVIHKLEQDDDAFYKLIHASVDSAEEYKNASFNRKGIIAREIEQNTRQASGIAKAKYVVEFVDALLKSGEKPLVYAWHHGVHDILEAGLAKYKPALITGRQTDTQKDGHFKRFVNGMTNVMILSLRSAAGLDGLQKRATCCVFAELDWSPAAHSQCETRIARLEVDPELKQLFSYYCVALNCYDEVMQDVLGLKASQFIGIMGDEPENIEEVKASEQRALDRINRLVEMLRGVRKV